MKDLWNTLKLLGNMLLFIGLIAGLFIIPYKIIYESTIDDTAKIYLILCVWCSIHYMMNNINKSLEEDLE